MNGLNSVYLLHHVTPEFSSSILLECGTEEDCIHVDRGIQYHEIIAILNVVVFSAYTLSSVSGWRFNSLIKKDLSKGS